jgi:hypothetical protein
VLAAAGRVHRRLRVGHGESSKATRQSFLSDIHVRDGHEQMLLAFLGPDLRDVDMEVADRMGLEGLPGWLLPRRSQATGLRRGA